MPIPSIPDGSKPKRSRSPIEVMGVSNDPTAKATAVGSTRTGRARRREQVVGDASIYTGRDVAPVERVFQQQPQQQRRIQHHHRGNGRIVSEAERPRDPDGGSAAAHHNRNHVSSRPRRLPALPKEGSLKPPPMLNMEQQTQLKHIQGRYLLERPLHLQRSPNPQEQPVWSSTTSGHHGAMSVPRYVNLMPSASASPHGPPTPIMKVPVFSTLAEALHHQHEQEKRKALQQQADHPQHPLGFVAHKPHLAPEVLYADVSQHHQRQQQQGGVGYGYDGRGSTPPLAVPQVVLQQQQPLTLSVPPNSNAIAAPATPVMVYSHPHGHYFMAYPPLTQATPTPIQMPQQEHTWNPYESVSPSGESCKGFGNDSGNVRQGKDDTSREASPVMVCSLPLASDGDHHIAQEKRVRASSHPVTVEVMDGSLKPGRSEQQHEVREESSLASVSQEGDFKTPRRPLKQEKDRDSRDPLNERGNDNGKENVGCHGNGGGDRGQLLGKKRGGDQIDKQMAYSESYFQVSPKSFLQPNKRQRNVSNTL